MIEDLHNRKIIIEYEELCIRNLGQCPQLIRYR